MRVVIQRVTSAAVTVADEPVASIGEGLLVLAGFEPEDRDVDLDWMAGKIVRLRIFADPEGVMNRCVLDTGGEVLLVSQFTLYASTHKGNRPSWARAAPAALSQPLFSRFAERVAAALGRPVATGVFGADMRVSLVNDGPVTILIDSREDR